MNEKLSPKTVANFMSYLSSAAVKHSERRKARSNMHSQLKKVKSLSGKTKVSKSVIDNEFNQLMEKLNEVIYKESKIIRNQRVNRSAVDSMGDSKSNEFLGAITHLEKKVDLAMQSESQLIAELKNRISHLEEQIETKENIASDLPKRINSIREAIEKMNQKIDVSSDREKRLEEVESKIKDQLYQDSIRVKRIESLISRLQKQSDDLPDNAHKERLQERIGVLKDKHKNIIDNQVEEEPIVENIEPIEVKKNPDLSSVNHLLEGSNVSSFKHILKKNEKMPPPPPADLHQSSVWGKVKGMFKL